MGGKPTGYYILDADGETPVPCDDILEWARWFEYARRHVARDDLRENDEHVRVSTVFLGFDHRLTPRTEAPLAPLLWETMVFGGSRDREQHRYTSCRDALENHQRIVAELARNIYDDENVT